MYILLFKANYRKFQIWGGHSDGWTADALLLYQHDDSSPTAEFQTVFKSWCTCSYFQIRLQYWDRPLGICELGLFGGTCNLEHCLFLFIWCLEWGAARVMYPIVCMIMLKA